MSLTALQVAALRAAASFEKYAKAEVLDDLITIFGAMEKAEQRTVLGLVSPNIAMILRPYDDPLGTSDFPSDFVD